MKKSSSDNPEPRAPGVLRDPGPMLGVSSLIALLIFSLSATTWIVIDQGSQGRGISLFVTGPQAPPAGSPAIFHVKVSDPSGNAVPGARVSMSTIPSNAGFFEVPRLAAESVTDGSGIVSLGFPTPESGEVFDVIIRCSSPSGTEVCVHRLMPSRERTVTLETFIADDGLGRPVLSVSGILFEGPAEKPIRGEELSIDLHALPGGVPFPAASAAVITATGGFFIARMPCGPRGVPHSLRVHGRGIDSRFDLVVPNAGRGLIISAEVISRSVPPHVQSKRILSMSANLTGGSITHGVTFEIVVGEGVKLVAAPDGKAEISLDEFIVFGGNTAHAVTITAIDRAGNTGSLPYPLQISASEAEITLVPMGSTPAVGVEGSMAVMSPRRDKLSIPGVFIDPAQTGAVKFNLTPEGPIHQVKITLEDENGLTTTVSREIHASTLPLGISTVSGKFEFQAGEKITVQMSGPAVRKCDSLRVMIISGGHVADSFIPSGDSFEIDSSALKISGPFIVSVFRPSASLDAPLRDAVHLPLFSARKSMSLIHDRIGDADLKISTHGSGGQKLPFSLFAVLLSEKNSSKESGAFFSFDSSFSINSQARRDDAALNGDVGQMKSLHEWCAATLREIDGKIVPDPRGTVLKPENSLKSRHTGSRYLSYLLTFSMLMTIILGFCCLVATTAAAIHFLREKKSGPRDAPKTPMQGSFSAEMPGLTTIYAILTSISLWLFGGGEQASFWILTVLAGGYLYFAWRVTRAIRFPDPYQPIPAIYGYSSLVILFLTPLFVFLSRVHEARIVIPGALLLKFLAAATLTVFPMMLSVFSDAAQGGGPSSFRQVLSGLGASAIISAALIFSPPFPPMDWTVGAEMISQTSNPAAKFSWTIDAGRGSPEIILARKALGFPKIDTIDDRSYGLQLNGMAPGSLYVMATGPGGAISALTISFGGGRCSSPVLAAPSLLTAGDSFEGFLTVSNPGQSPVTLSSTIGSVPGLGFLPFLGSTGSGHPEQGQVFKLNVPAMGIETIPLEISPTSPGIFPLRVTLSSQEFKWSREAGICIVPADGWPVWSGIVALEQPASNSVTPRIPGYLRVGSCRLVAFRDLLDFSGGSLRAVQAGEPEGETLPLAAQCLMDDAEELARPEDDSPRGDFAGAFLGAAAREWAFLFGTAQSSGHVIEPLGPTILGKPIMAAWLLAHTRNGGPLASLLCRKAAERLPDLPGPETFTGSGISLNPHPEWLLQAHLLLTSARFLAGESPINETAALLGLVKTVSESLKTPSTMIAAIELETLAKLRADGIVRALPGSRRPMKGGTGSSGIRSVLPGRLSAKFLKKIFPPRKTPIDRLPLKSESWDLFHSCSRDPDSLLGSTALLTLGWLENSDWERGLLENQLFAKLPGSWPWPSDPSMAVSLAALLPEILEARKNATKESGKSDKISVLLGSDEVIMHRFSSLRGDLWTGCGELESDVPPRKISFPAGWPESYKGYRPILFMEAIGPGPPIGLTLGLDCSAAPETSDACLGDSLKFSVTVRRSIHMSKNSQTVVLRLPESLIPNENTLEWNIDGSIGRFRDNGPGNRRRISHGLNRSVMDSNRRSRGVGFPGKTVVFKLEAGVKNASLDILCTASARCSLESAGSVSVISPGGETVHVDPGPLEIR